MKEFIFGTMSTDEKRLSFLREQHRGLKHLFRLSPAAPHAGQPVTITVTAQLPFAMKRVTCYISHPEPAEIELQRVKADWDLLNWSYYQHWQVTLPPQPEGTLVRYTIEGQARHGSSRVQADEGTVFSYLVGDPGPPDWAAEAVIYQLFPDRFNPGQGRSWHDTDDLDEIHGGTLPGIIEKLDYIADLGFNCIWLNPFFPDHTHHGYHATDYFQVNPRLGTMDDIRELVEQAHARGIRLILDFVANHWGSGHDTFQDALKSQDSPYYDWYNWIDWPVDYESFFAVKDLPQVNVNHPDARKYLLDSAEFWLQEIDFDGYRLDYAPGPTLDFWTEFRAVVKATRPDAWIFGEVVETPAQQMQYYGRLDGCLDFMLQQALRNTFAFGEMSLADFDAFLGRHESYFPAKFSRPSFLDNHDVNRFLWLVQGNKERLKLAMLCLFTLSGPPIVYYGTEVGLSQDRDIMHPDGRHIMSESRKRMPWGKAQDSDLYEWFRWLIHFRRQHPVLWSGSRETVHLDEEAGTYAFTRSDNKTTIVVALNLSDQQRIFSAAGEQFTLAAYGGEVRVV